MAKKIPHCERACMEDFTTCMQMALDSFAMGACYDAEKRCEYQCKLKQQKKRSHFLCLMRLCRKPCERCERD